MTPLTHLTSIAAPLLRDNVDTDTIIPSREIKSTGRTGLADGLFAPWRYQDVGDPAARRRHPEFVLNRPGYAQAKILVSGANFGCGSSREHAVWALAEWGFRAIVAASFAPIFRNNCIRNGVLPVVLDAGAIAEIAGQETMIDLSGQTVGMGEKTWKFDIDAESKTMLLEGLDVIDLTLKHAPAIADWTAHDRIARPWVYLPPPSGEKDRPRSGQDEGPYRRQTPQHLLERSRTMRTDPTDAEAKLWRHLRGRRLSGHKFRRQVPIGAYIADFVSPDAKLIVELDGSQHIDQQSYDAHRTAFLQREGYRVLRIWNNDALSRTGDVMEAILHELTAPHPGAARLSFSPEGEGI